MREAGFWIQDTGNKILELEQGCIDGHPVPERDPMDKELLAAVLNMMQNT